MCCLGWLLQTGKWVERDPEAAVTLYRDAAELGSSRAMTQLGDCLLEGIGTACVPDLALRCYEKGAAEGEKEAMFSLGYCHEFGLGTEQDYTQAAQWYLRAAQEGSTAGMNNLAELLAKGRGVERDLGQALEWYRKAADLGNACAQYNLGWYLQQAGNEEKALGCYEKAKEGGMTSALWALGCFYEEGGASLERDLEKAYDLYRQGAEDGNLNCKCRLVRCLALGLGVKQDVPEALRQGADLDEDHYADQMDNYGARQELDMVRELLDGLKKETT